MGKYSWKAVTCCVSKGILTIAAIVIFLGTFIGSMIYVDRLHDARCALLGDQIVDAMHSNNQQKYDHLTQQYHEQCERQPPPKLETGFVFGILGLMAFMFIALLLAAICSANITYCQAAVDTGRRPWYWVPKIGDPLPGRGMIKCGHCGESKPETDDEYRARLGLRPLGSR